MSRAPIWTGRYTKARELWSVDMSEVHLAYSPTAGDPAALRHNAPFEERLREAAAIDTRASTPACTGPANDLLPATGTPTTEGEPTEAQER